MPDISPEFAVQYAALSEGAGLVDCSDRTQIEVFGADRAAFLHNLCTNAVRNLAPGGGCEAFFLNAKGHIVGHGFLLAGEQSIVVDSAPGQAEFLMAHLDRYLIREDVRLENRGGEWSEMLLAGAKAETLLEGAGVAIPAQRLEHAAGTIAGRQVWIRRIDLAGPNSLLIACERAAHDAVASELQSLGAVACDPAVYECRRIEHGMPLFGVDITDDHLPQEVDRNREAISFTKGCYLGQETVARIDALGHVNRLLRRAERSRSRRRTRQRRQAGRQSHVRLLVATTGRGRFAGLPPPRLSRTGHGA